MNSSVKVEIEKSLLYNNWRWSIKQSDNSFEWISGYYNYCIIDTNRVEKALNIVNELQQIKKSKYNSEEQESYYQKRIRKLNKQFKEMKDKYES